MGPELEAAVIEYRAWLQSRGEPGDELGEEELLTRAVRRAMAGRFEARIGDVVTLPLPDRHWTSAMGIRMVLSDINMEKEPFADPDRDLGAYNVTALFMSVPPGYRPP